MRSIYWFIACTCLMAFILPGAVRAQDGKPAVQVVVAPDGSVRVFDAKTGKEIPSVVTRPQAKPGEGKGIVVEAELMDLEFEDIAKILQHGIRKKTGKDGLFEIELELGLGGQPKPKTTDDKLDLLLKQMAELRRDVNHLKAKLDGKQPDGFTPGMFLWKWTDKKFDFPMGGQLDKETVQRILEMLKKTKDDGDGKTKKDTPKKEREPRDGNAELERQLDRILREAEALRKEIQKAKGGAK